MPPVRGKGWGLRLAGIEWFVFKAPEFLLKGHVMKTTFSTLSTLLLDKLTCLVYINSIPGKLIRKHSEGGASIRLQQIQIPVI